MKVLVLGGSGLIGLAVVTELVNHRYEVLALSRSEPAADSLRQIRANVLSGDLCAPQDWATAVTRVEAIIQLAITFTDDAGAVEQKMFTALTQTLAAAKSKIRLINTGSVWLYGATGDNPADDSAAAGTQFHPIANFAWAVNNGKALLASPQFLTAVIHPAMVYHQTGGAFAGYIARGQDHSPIKIWGSSATRWPLVHRDDLAVAYRLLLEQPTLTGHFNASARIEVRADVIAAAIAKKYRSPRGSMILPAAAVLKKYGRWAVGPMLDQQMMSSRLPNLCNWRPLSCDFGTCL